MKGDVGTATIAAGGFVPGPAPRVTPELASRTSKLARARLARGPGFGRPACRGSPSVAMVPYEPDCRWVLEGGATPVVCATPGCSRLPGRRNPRRRFLDPGRAAGGWSRPHSTAHVTPYPQIRRRAAMNWQGNGQVTGRHGTSRAADRLPVQ